MAFINQARGILYADVTTNKHATNNTLFKTVGESSAQSILGLITFGSAGASDAAAEAKIVEIATVDEHFTSVLSIYSRMCTQVS
jgi:hypothetical protein